MKSVVFCTSQRFRFELDEFIKDLRERAHTRNSHLVIFTPNFEDDDPSLALLHEKERLKNALYHATVAGKVYDHLFRKVRVADVCFIFNKNGYIGINTSGELFAAAILGKTVYALDKRMLMGNYPHDLYEEPSPHKLVHEIVETPQELLERLM
ncbi:MAG: hypothetical protein Q8R36_05190 [bacterium]|nr:hypothetical protein [bacterium]